MFLAEIDPIQVIIIVIAMGAGFVQWLWGLLKQKLAENERRNAPPMSADEQKARQEAWRRQTQTGGPPPRPSPKAPPPIHDPWSSVRDVFDQIKDEAQKSQNTPPPQRPRTPPPLQAPQNQRTHPGTVRAEVRPSPQPAPIPADPFPVSAPKVVTPPVFFAAPASPPLVSRSKSDSFDLGQLLLNSTTARQAVLLREILGPPKALQSSEDSAF